MHDTDIINPTYFLNWLRLQEPTRNFATLDRCKTCPLAAFLVEALPFTYASVKVAGFNVSTGERAKYHPLPAWAIDFVRLFDITDVYNDTAAKAVRIMEELNVQDIPQDY